MKSFNTNTNTNTTNTTTTTTIPMLDPKSPDFSLFATALIDKLFPRVALAATSTTTDTTTTPTASPKTPEQPLHVFMYRLMQLTTLPSQITYLAIYYITQLKIKNPKLKLGMGIERRLIVACIVIAQKMLDDNRWTNKTWSKVSGVPLQDINSMEAEIMNRLHYRLHVGKREFEKWCLLVNSTTMRSISSSSSLLQKKKQEEEGRRGETIPIHRLPTPPMEEEEIRTTLSAPTFLASSFNSNNASAATPLLAPLPLKRSVSLDSEETIMPAPKRRDSPSRPYTPPSEIKL